MDDYKPWKNDENYLVYSDGRIYSMASGTFLKPTDTRGYLAVGLRKGPDGKRRNTRIHIMVATMWCPNPDNKPQVDHINRNKHDNDHKNLRWVNYVENSRNKNPLVKTKNTAAVQQWSQDGETLIETFSSIKKAVEMTGSCRTTIIGCCRGRYKHVISQDGIPYKWVYADPTRTEKIDIPENSRVIKDFPDYYATRGGRIYSTKTKRYLNPSKSEGFMCVNLTGEKDGKKPATRYLARIIAETFIDDKPENYSELTVFHKDLNKENNHVDNLQYCTLVETVNNTTKITGGNTRKINVLNSTTGEIIGSFTSMTSAAESIKGSVSSICNVLSGKQKTHAGYKFEYCD